eukprot:gnl/Chilomastix_cuspidata/983.p1 GENE.gnl/Chilomastix_cuspidata/983~~gnl/Chilomastix_cuspidata/983.p1  ORF type:complete len:734 (+),score=330.24 gnl/Chilomastix_cuspidata/983:75-2276(+)
MEPDAHGAPGGPEREVNGDTLPARTPSKHRKPHRTSKKKSKDRKHKKKSHSKSKAPRNEDTLKPTDLQDIYSDAPASMAEVFVSPAPPMLPSPAPPAFADATPSTELTLTASLRDAPTAYRSRADQDVIRVVSEHESSVLHSVVSPSGFSEAERDRIAHSTPDIRGRARRYSRYGMPRRIYREAFSPIEEEAPESSELPSESEEELAELAAQYNQSKLMSLIGRVRSTLQSRAARVSHAADADAELPESELEPESESEPAPSVEEEPALSEDASADDGAPPRPGRLGALFKGMASSLRGRFGASRAAIGDEDESDEDYVPEEESSSEPLRLNLSSDDDELMPPAAEEEAAAHPALAGASALIAQKLGWFLREVLPAIFLIFSLAVVALAAARFVPGALRARAEQRAARTPEPVLPEEPLRVEPPEPAVTHAVTHEVIDRRAFDEALERALASVTAKIAALTSAQLELEASLALLRDAAATPVDAAVDGPRLGPELAARFDELAAAVQAAHARIDELEGTHGDGARAAREQLGLLEMRVALLNASIASQPCVKLPAAAATAAATQRGVTWYPAEWGYDFASSVMGGRLLKSALSKRVSGADMYSPLDFVPEFAACLPLQAPARVGVQLGCGMFCESERRWEGIEPRHVAIHHLGFPAGGARPAYAPAEFDVFGVRADGNHVLLREGARYDPDGPELQRFALTPTGERFQKVAVDFKSAAHESGWVCLYSLRVFE